MTARTALPATFAALAFACVLSGCFGDDEEAAREQPIRGHLLKLYTSRPTEGPSALELQKESLDAVEAARLRLDEVRARRPE